MDQAERKQFNDIWLANEQKIQDARNLKAGEVDPVQRLEDVEADQDRIEYELDIDYIERLRRG
jgi:hypothetical protein